MKSLSPSVNNLKPDDPFKYTSKCFSVNTQLMTKKCLYPYLYRDFFEKFTFEVKKNLLTSF